MKAIFYLCVGFFRFKEERWCVLLADREKMHIDLFAFLEKNINLRPIYYFLKNYKWKNYQKLTNCMEAKKDTEPRWLEFTSTNFANFTFYSTKYSIDTIFFVNISHNGNINITRQISLNYKLPFVGHYSRLHIKLLNAKNKLFKKSYLKIYEHHFIL